MDLHGRIMNLPDGCGLSEIGTTHGEQLAYKRGHRNARHAAAELAMKADAEREALFNALTRLIGCYSVSHSPATRQSAWEQAHKAVAMSNAKVSGGGAFPPSA